ncbi:Rv1355c family protein [Daejeonella oryzae]|uniref:Rv1355c family protein n=1 Tax=Daejeonella oryzae TaxID=1122943 RepID=UPI0004040659|nr:Rv1355c family protein [Daejeonella oryzae]
MEHQTTLSSETFKPQFYRLSNESDKADFNVLKNLPYVEIYDEIEGQLTELIKSLNPSERIVASEYPDRILKHLNGQPISEYGVWVYYPWSKKLVHLLDEHEFIEVRTNRNRNKITREEQEKLKTKKIGIIGLSVGQSIALTIAMERTCGELRLADFDTAELSNLNRLRTGVHNLGLKKTIIAAREILEIDPFITVKIFNEGLNDENIADFLTADGKLDLLVEVCDGLDIKVKSRLKSREFEIPVLMDTNDRGMLDIERFDLEPDRPLLHGLLGRINPEKISSLSNTEKMELIFRIVGSETISQRLKDSVPELGKTLNSLPQLASSVVLGGAISTDAARRILLDQFQASGRFYVDTEELIKEDQVFI